MLGAYSPQDSLGDSLSPFTQYITVVVHQDDGQDSLEGEST